MSVIVVLIGFSLVVAGGFLAAFLWAVRSGQYSDTYTPSVRVLFENSATSLPEGEREEKLDGDGKVQVQEQEQVQE